MARTAAANGLPGGLQTRRRIMDAAFSVFRELGYEAKMDAIAAAADVSKQTLYNQFGSKEELFKAIISEKSAAMRATIAAAEETQPPREVLLALAREYYALAFTPQSLGFLRTIIAASQRFPEIGSDFYAAGPRQTLDALSAWMSRQDALGNLRTGTPRLAAEHFMSLILGHVQTQGLLGIDGGLASEELDERARFCVDAFMRAFGP